jgi:hypothetical protein
MVKSVGVIEAIAYGVRVTERGLRPASPQEMGKRYLHLQYNQYKRMLLIPCRTFGQGHQGQPEVKEGYRE